MQRAPFSEGIAFTYRHKYTYCTPKLVLEMAGCYWGEPV